MILRLSIDRCTYDWTYLKKNVGDFGNSKREMIFKGQTDESRYLSFLFACVK